jgi:hypothetical protein
MLVEIGMYKVIKLGKFPDIATLYRYTGKAKINRKLTPEQDKQRIAEVKEQLGIE